MFHSCYPKLVSSSVLPRCVVAIEVTNSFTELHLCLNTEKILCTGDETVVQWKTYVTQLQFFEDVFFEAGVFNFHVVLKVE